MLAERGVFHVVAGHDNRDSSDDFHEEVISGLMSCGIQVIDIGLAISPIMYWAQNHVKTPRLAMVTGSHSPKEWNGLKLGYDFSLAWLRRRPVRGAQAAGVRARPGQTADQTMSETGAGTPDYVSTPMIHRDCPDGAKYGIVDRLTEEFRRGHDVIDIACTCAEFGDG